MKRLSTAIAIAITVTLGACGGEDKTTAKKQQELRPLDPDPPMSASDIDSIVNETRDRDATRGGGATAPSAENASDAK